MPPPPNEAHISPSELNAGLGFPDILDACCGGRQFWFDKKNPNVLFADSRVMPPKVVGSGKDARTRKCLPDRVHDFRDMEYPDATLQMVVFDPPHLFLGGNSFMARRFESWFCGMLQGTRGWWRADFQVERMGHTAQRNPEMPTTPAAF